MTRTAQEPARPGQAPAAEPTWDEVVAFVRDALASFSPGTPISRDVWRRCGAFGLLGLPVPREHGGRGLTALASARTLEALGYACAHNGLMAAIAAHLLSCVVPLWRRGSDDQKERYLGRLCRGEWIAAHAATEPEAGSDIFALRTRARREGGEYVLDGCKTLSLSAPLADLFVVFAHVTPEPAPEGVTAFLVERGTPGATVTRSIEMAGLRGAVMGEIVFEGCRVPESNRLGPEGDGTLIFHLAMRWERSLFLSSHVGGMRRVLEQAVERARARRQFGRPISEFQSVSNRLAEMKVRLELSRLALHAAARSVDEGRRDALEPSIAKLYISEAAAASYLDALRIHGGRGFTREAEFADDLMDALGTTLLSGTSDVQRQIIARQIGA